jgi:hypothetical protein
MIACRYAARRKRAENMEKRDIKQASDRQKKKDPLSKKSTLKHCDLKKESSAVMDSNESVQNGNSQLTKASTTRGHSKKKIRHVGVDQTAQKDGHSEIATSEKGHTETKAKLYNLYKTKKNTGLASLPDNSFCEYLILFLIQFCKMSTRNL